MPCSTTKKILYLAISNFLFNQNLKAETVQVNILAKHDLQAGRISDGIELATIYLSNIKDNCDLNIWSESATAQSPPGTYTITNRGGRRETLNVKLSGNNVILNTDSGRGMHLLMPDKTATLRLLANGDQLIRKNVWPVTFKFQCVNKKEDR